MKTVVESIAKKLETIVITHQWPLLLLIIVSGLLLRVSGIFSVCIFHDEGKFLYKTSEILKGAVLNRDFGDVSLYGIFTFLIFSFSIFGKSVFHTRLLFSSVNMITVLFVYLVARELYGKKVGLLSSLLFAVTPSVVAWSRLVMADPLTTLFALIGLYMFLVAEKKNSRLDLFWSGLSLGVSFLMKPVGILMFLVISLYLLVKDFRQRKSFRLGSTKIAYLFLGLVPPLCIFICYVLVTNTLNNLWLVNTFFYNFYYFNYFPTSLHGNTMSVSYIGGVLWKRVVQFVNAAKYSQVTWLGGAAGAVYLGYQKKTYGLLVSWLLAFMVPFLFLTAALSHYTYFVMPSLSILAAVLIIELVSKRKSMKPKKSGLSVRRILLLCCLVLLLSYAAYRISCDNLVLASWLPEDFTPTKIPPLELQMRVGEYIKAHTSSDEKVYVWTLTYAFVADRSAVSNAVGNPASKFPSPFGIINQLKEKEVRYAVLDFQARHYLDTYYWGELGEYIKSHYVIEEIFGSEAFEYYPPGTIDVYVYRSMDSIPQLVRFKDHFDKLDSASNWDVAEGTWTVKNGEYEVVGMGVSYVKDFTASRFILEARQKIMNYGETTANWLGFLVRKRSMDESFLQGYLIKLRYDGIIEICKDGSALASVQTGVSPSTFVTVKLIVFGYDIKVYVNDVLYLDVVNVAYPDGYIALVSNVSHGYFDDIIVKTPKNWPSTYAFGDSFSGMSRRSSAQFRVENSYESKVSLCMNCNLKLNFNDVYVDHVMRKRK